MRTLNAKRQEVIREVGCIACRAMGYGYVACEVHHLTLGGKHGQKRRGEQFTVGLCTFHHRGQPDGYGHERGPSYALQPRAFRERFGNDAALLAQQNALIGEAA